MATLIGGSCACCGALVSSPDFALPRHGSDGFLRLSRHSLRAGRRVPPAGGGAADGVDAARQEGEGVLIRGGSE